MDFSAGQGGSVRRGGGGRASDRCQQRDKRRDYRDLWIPQSSERKLRAEKKVEDLQNQLTEAQLTEQKLQQLRELSQSLNYADYDDNYERVTADVIATDGSNLFNVFTVNAGKDDGVTAGSIVVNEDGL